MTPHRVFLDTNVFILGAAEPLEPEGIILRWAGFEAGNSEVEVVLSDEVIDQLRRVGRRLYGKDWAGDLLGTIWRNMRVVYALIDPKEWALLTQAETHIPREDIGIYLTARIGGAQCFISGNHQLVKALAESSGTFECLTPSEFVTRYLAQ
jgi:predicted nucleic acid-binding protein